MLISIWRVTASSLFSDNVGLATGVHFFFSGSVARWHVVHTSTSSSAAASASQTPSIWSVLINILVKLSVLVISVSWWASLTSFVHASWCTSWTFSSWVEVVEVASWSFSVCVWAFKVAWVTMSILLLHASLAVRVEVFLESVSWRRTVSVVWIILVPWRAMHRWSEASHATSASSHASVWSHVKVIVASWLVSVSLVISSTSVVVVGWYVFVISLAVVLIGVATSAFVMTTSWMMTSSCCFSWLVITASGASLTTTVASETSLGILSVFWLFDIAAVVLDEPSEVLPSQIVVVGRLALTFTFSFKGGLLVLIIILLSVLLVILVVVSVPTLVLFLVLFGVFLLVLGWFGWVIIIWVLWLRILVPNISFVKLYL